MCDSSEGRSNDDLVPITIFGSSHQQASAVIWIFSDFEIEDNATLYITLYAMFDSVQKYKDIDIEDCIDFVTAHKNTEFVVIVSMKCALNIISHIHDLRQLESIYIYNLSNSMENVALYSYTKINGFYGNINCLFQNLQNVIKAHNVCMSQENMSTILIYSESDLCTKVFSTVLLQLEYNREKACKTFVDKCRACYGGNPIISKHLEEFEHSYNRTKAIYWYTRDSFLFRLLNKALRTMNIQAIFMCHFIIVDIHKALEEEYTKLSNEDNHALSPTSIVQCYHGQRMSCNELEQLMLSLHEFIIVKSFLSASVNPEVALMFGGSHLNGNKDQDIFVLYIITINRTVKHTPFAYIKNQSVFEDEAEILFTMCSIFLIENIIYDDKRGVWNINLSLINENDQRLLDRLDQLRSRRLFELSFAIQIMESGRLICRSESRELSSVYYNILLREYSTDDSTCECACYSGLGWNAFLEGNYELALSNQEKALALCPSSTDKRGQGLKTIILNHMGEIYEALGLFELALQTYTKAAVDLDSIDLDQYDLFNGFSIIPNKKIAQWHRIQCHFDIAMEIFDKIIEVKRLSDIEDRVSLYHEIAIAGSTVLYENDESTHMIHWKNFIDFGSVHYLPKYYNEIAREYSVIGDKILAYKKSISFDRTNLTVECYRKSIDILSHYAPKEHKIIANCYVSLARIYAKMGSNESNLAAIQHYEKVLEHIPSDTSYAPLIALLSSCSEEVADIYGLTNQFNLAIDRLSKAAEYRRRLLHATMSVDKPYFNTEAALTNEKISVCYNKIADIYETLAAKYRKKSSTDLEALEGVHDPFMGKFISTPIAPESEIFDKRIKDIFLSAQMVVKTTKIFKCLRDHELVLYEHKECGYKCDKCCKHFDARVPSWYCTEDDYDKCCRCLVKEICNFDRTLLDGL